MTIKKNNLVSIIMPFYKKERYFKEAYNSAVKQTYKNIEIIIVCDENTERAKKFLKNYEKNKKTKIYYNSKNLGVALSRNIGIKKSKGKFIAFLDCDDLWKKNKIEIQLKWMLMNNLNFSHTSYDIINEKGEKIGKQNAKKSLSYNALLKCCYIGTSSVIVLKTLIQKNLFKNISTQEDYITWLNISKKKSLNGMYLTLSSWRSSHNSLSRNFYTKLINAFLVYYKYQKINFVTSVYRLLVLVFFNILKKIQNKINA